MFKKCITIAFISALVFALTACGGVAKDGAVESPTFEIPIPVASGINVAKNDIASIDHSNLHDGYIIVEYFGGLEVKHRVLVTAPHEETYVYTLNGNGFPEVIPLAEGEGTYEIGVYENLSGDSYTEVLSTTIEVKFEDEHAPFIRPNQFVNYSKESNLVEVAAGVISDTASVKEKIVTIYDFVVDNFTYDYDLAATVPTGYLPNLDEVLNLKKGICFDYSALVTAMLRSQGVPVKLDIGWYYDEYHAWISIFCEENGWLDHRYHHDGDEWNMLDPTFDSGENVKHRSRLHARDDDEYQIIFNY